MAEQHFIFPNIQKPVGRNQINTKVSIRLGKDILLLVWIGDAVFYLQGREEISDFLNATSKADDARIDLFNYLFEVVKSAYEQDDMVQKGTTIGDLF